MDNFAIAVSRYRRRKYDESINLCDKILQENNLDQSAWILKASSLIRKQFLDDIEIDELGIGDLLMNDESINTIARPGTSLQRPGSQAGLVFIIFIYLGIRPMSKMGRLQTGYARPVTNRQDNQENIVKTARVGTRLGTARPMTQGGRYIRLGTASLQQMGDQFIQIEKLDLKKMSQKPVISRVLCDYLIYVEHNPRKALQLAAEATQTSHYQDWWWKERLGKAYFLLGLYREAEKQFNSSLKIQEMIKTQLQLAKVYLRIDQPKQAIELYKKCNERFPFETSFLIGIARVYDQLNQPNESVKFYTTTLSKDNSNIEAVASLGAYHFYLDQPEVALQFYKRLLQLGIYTSEIWNNIGLCCFYSGQYDLFYSCFERALSIADDQQRAEIWYNLSHIFINLGDSGTAYQCLKITLCYDPHHGEAYNNLAVVQSKRKDYDKAKNNFSKAIETNEYLYEPIYNQSVLMFNQLDYQQCYQLIQRALKIFPDHPESLELNEKVLQILQQI